MTEITLQQLPGLRRVTRGLADFLEPQLRSQVGFLAPLLRPKRLLGTRIEGPTVEKYTWEEQALDELMAGYQKVYGPLGLHPKLPSPIPAIRARLELSPWEETWTPPSGAPVRVTSPLCWVVAYPGGCTLGALREMLAGGRVRDPEQIQRTALNHCILALLLARTPEFAQLMGALRYAVDIRQISECPDLPIPVIRSLIPSVRPPAGVMQDAVELAGLQAFEEVVDPGCLATIQDPLRETLEGLLAQHVAPAS